MEFIKKIKTKNMKCLKNTKTGNIIRVTDVQAHQMAGSQWRYVSKSEWRGVREPIVEEVKTEVVETIKEKKSKKK
jgi:hypothetical protein